MNKEQVIDSIVGLGVALPDRAVKLGLARYTGNQWNEDWSWDREALTKCPVEDLQQLYEHLKGKSCPVQYS